MNSSFSVIIRPPSRTSTLPYAGVSRMSICCTALFLDAICSIVFIEKRTSRVCSSVYQSSVCICLAFRSVFRGVPRQRPSDAHSERLLNAADFPCTLIISKYCARVGAQTEAPQTIDGVTQVANLGYTKFRAVRSVRGLRRDCTKSRRSRTTDRTTCAVRGAPAALPRLRLRLRLRRTPLRRSQAST